MTESHDLTYWLAHSIVHFAVDLPILWLMIGGIARWVKLYETFGTYILDSLEG